MPSLTRKQSNNKSSTSKGSRSRRSDGSYSSKPTTPTSLYTSPRPSDLKASSSSAASRPRSQQSYESCPGDDLSPSTSLCPRSSADSYASTTASEEDLNNAMDLDSLSDRETSSTIPPLPVYRHEAVEPNVRPSSPQEFGRLFPSLNRLSIRHDEFTSDGNMNLRVDTIVTGRRRTAIQLFHLRMYNLDRREFSLRRYCRDSGREVCNAKRKYVEAPVPKPPKAADERPTTTLQRSVTTAIKTLSGRPGYRRTSSSGSIFGGGGRPGTAHSWGDGDDETLGDTFSSLSLDSRGSAASSSRKSSNNSAKPHPKAKKRQPEPTNTIKLEFSNYARVDVTRRGGGATAGHRRYEFDWWGHRYSWRLAAERTPTAGAASDCMSSFHLVRDGDAARPVAHIVPETRSPSQVLADESAGGWVPPCYMWIADESVVDAVTDVADVIMATGLMALVDECITEKLQPKRVRRIPLPLTSRTVDVPMTFVPPLFRRNTAEHTPSSPLRYGRAISAY